MPVLVDSSVWIEHCRYDNQTLRNLLEKDPVSTHPLVVGELACGRPPDRKMTLKYLQRLTDVQIATSQETLDLIERDKLYGTGAGGWISCCWLLALLHLHADCGHSTSDLASMHSDMTSCMSPESSRLGNHNLPLQQGVQTGQMTAFGARWANSAKLM